MRSAYTNTKVINGQSSTLQKLCWLLLCFGIIGLSTALVYTLTNNKVSSPKSVPVEAQLPHGSIEELSDPKTFTAAYLSVNCKPDLLRHTQTLRVAGTIERDGISETFTLIKKRPNKMRFLVKQGEAMTLIVFLMVALYNRLSSLYLHVSATLSPGKWFDGFWCRPREYD